MPLGSGVRLFRNARFALSSSKGRCKFGPRQLTGQTPLVYRVHRCEFGFKPGNTPLATGRPDLDSVWMKYVTAGCLDKSSDKLYFTHVTND